ncbi:hypothetical protein B0H12DRAFT_1078029 [Mycena haematopus]|nr:hypothetical protein B0H12DRAFT_1078029 [Mycena haematopus]
MCKLLQPPPASNNSALNPPIDESRAKLSAGRTITFTYVRRRTSRVLARFLLILPPTATRRGDRTSLAIGRRYLHRRAPQLRRCARNDFHTPLTTSTPANHRRESILSAVEEGGSAPENKTEGRTLRTSKKHQQDTKSRLAGAVPVAAGARAAWYSAGSGPLL